MTDDFSLASPAGHLIMGDSSGPDGLATKDGAKALSRAVSVDTATTQLHTPSSTKNLIIEFVVNWEQRPSSASCQRHELPSYLPITKDSPSSLPLRTFPWAMKNQNEGSPTVSGHYPCHWKEVRVA